MDPDGQWLMADRAEVVQLPAFFGTEADVAFAMAVKVVFPFLRKEFHRADQAAVVFFLQGPPQAGKLKVGVEQISLASQLRRRVTVRIGDQPVPVKAGEQPVHGRIGRKPGFQGKDMPAQISKAFLNGIESRLGPEQGKPRCPDMGRHQEAVIGVFQQDFEQIAGVKTENGAAVRFDVADGGKFCIDPGGIFEGWDIEKIMDLADLAVPFVNTADLGRQHKTELDGFRAYVRKCLGGRGFKRKKPGSAGTRFSCRC